MNDCGNMLKEGFHKLPWVPLENEIYISHIMHISYIYICTSKKWIFSNLSTLVNLYKNFQ